MGSRSLTKLVEIAQERTTRIGRYAFETESGHHGIDCLCSCAHLPVAVAGQTFCQHLNLVQH